MSVSYKCAITGHSPPYLVEFPLADVSGRAQATVQDLLEHAAQHHEADCGCNLKVGTRVWLSSGPPSNASNYDWATPSRDPLRIDSVLDTLSAATESSNVLVIAGGHPPSQDHLLFYREQKFVPYRAHDAIVFQRAGAPPTLPPRISTSFDALCAIPGSTFVDKSQFLHPLLCELSSERVAIIRRPKGFGKTTLLSMFGAFFDPLSVHAHLPSSFTGDMSCSIFKQHGQLLVFALDFADLAFERDMGRDDLEAECDRFMNAAAKTFYTKYKGLLCVGDAETSHPDFAPTFHHIIRWAKGQGWKLCFTIDNYTAPVLEDDMFARKYVMSEDIFKRLSNLVRSSFVRYGLILGDDVAHATNWPGLPSIFTDLTAAPAFAQAIGFTVDEVSALGQAVSADLISALPSGTPTGRYAKRVYAAADIIALARFVTSAGGPDEPAPVKVRTFKHPPPVKGKDQPSKATTKPAPAQPVRGAPLKLFTFEPSRPGDGQGDGDGLVIIAIKPRSRGLTDADSPAEPVLTTARASNHPSAVKAKTERRKTASATSRKRARLEEALFNVPHKAFDDFGHAHGPSDDDDQDSAGSSDRSLQVPELSDGSSGGSSSGSSDSSSEGRSSAPSSGGDKGRILLPVHDEPSSPLEGYAKKPWVSDSL